jgi:5-formyltetrahydrofolate cyclo-ligase
MTSKDKLRQEARARRKAVPDFAEALARHFEVLAVKPGQVVGGYHALGTEADPALLLARLAERGARIAFPRVAAKQAALEFHLVPEGEALRPGAFGIHEPSADWPTIIPDLLLVPLLAFDAAGHRLGYGGGYYDRTLEALKTPAIGIAYAEQEIGFIPAEAHDRTLDAVLTERGLRRFA